MVDMFFISSNYIKCSILLVILLLVGIEAIAFVVDLLPLSPRLLALLTPHLPHHLRPMLPHFPHHLRSLLSHLPHHLSPMLPHLPYHLRSLLPHHLLPLLTHNTMLPHHLRRHSSVSHLRLSRQALSPRVHL